MATANLEGITILLAEDDPDLRECLSDNLSLLGARVLSAENGRAALELFAHERVDAILSDMRMPGGDGLAFLRAVREKDSKHPPFVFLSGYSDIAPEFAKKEGAQDMLAKPCDMRELTGRILSFVRG